MNTENSNRRGIIHPSLAVLAYAALALVGVEAVRHQTGQWLAVAAATLAWFVFSGWTTVRRKRAGKPVNWGLHAFFSWLVLSGLLVCAVALNQGVPGSLTVLNYDADTLLLVVFVLLIIAAVAIALFSRLKPTWLRLALAVPGLYGVLSLALLAYQRQPFSSLWSGEAFWSALPAWLQGPIFGAITVTLALALLIWNSVSKKSRVSWSATGSYAGIATAIAAVSMLSAGMVAPLDNSSTALIDIDDQATAQQTPKQAEQDRASDRPKSRASKKLPELSNKLPDTIESGTVIDKVLETAETFKTHDFNLEALAQHLGDNPESAFEYVRDQIEFEPYRGSLRGAHGTLAGRAGNHLDRALLLKSLFDLQGVEARLAVGQLAARSAAKLKLRPLQTPLYNGQNDPALGLAGLHGSSLQRLQARAERDYIWLSDALEDQINSVTPADAAEIERQNHVWVQVRTEGKWLDFDPTLKSAEPGETLGYFEKTIKQPAKAEQHSVKIKLVAESVAADGTLGKSTVLEQRLNAAEAAPAQIFLTFSPDVASRGLGGIVSKAGAQEKGFQPLLMVDGKIEAGKKLPGLGLTKSDAQDFFFGGSDAQSVLSALYLEITAASPGNQVKQSRTLFDRIPQQDRAARSFAIDRLAELELIGDTPTIFGSAHNIIVSNGGNNPRETANDIVFAVDFFGREMLDPEKFKDVSLHELLWPIGAANQAMALAAERLSVASLNDLPGLRFFVGAPRVYIFSIQPYVNGDVVGRDFEIDLMHDSVSWVAENDIQPEDIVRRRLRYGVTQQALETTVGEQRAQAAGYESASVISASVALTGDLKAINKSDLNDSTYPPALADAVRKGQLVMMSPGASESWWRFDPETGELSARLAPDLGGIKLTGTLPRSSAAGGGVGDMVRQPRGPGGTWRVTPNGRIVPDGPRSPPTNSCKGGTTEYTIVMCNVSIKISMTTGWAHTIIVGEIVASVTAVLAQL